jgi:hypothetical protein
LLGISVNTSTPTPTTATPAPIQVSLLRERGEDTTVAKRFDDSKRGIRYVSSVTSLARVVAGIAVAVLLVAAAPSHAGSQFRERRVVFVSIVGRGYVSSTPKGIACPKSCRSAAFFKSERVSLVARAAAGWRFVRWSGTWCTGTRRTCAFELADSHDCAGGMCPVGAFGLRVTFARSGESS